MDRYVIIMAGGSGTRFWPKSRRTLPKQLLSIFTGKTMVEETLLRATEVVPRENVFIVTTADQAALTRDLLGDAVDAANVIAEPFGRDTAPCIALACARVALSSGDASMLIMPADHVIRPVQEFVRAANAGFEAAETTEALVTFGVPPTGPVPSPRGMGGTPFDSQGAGGRGRRIPCRRSLRVRFSSSPLFPVPAGAC